MDDSKVKMDEFQKRAVEQAECYTDSIKNGHRGY